jgi:CRP-like cAMP-binding protein
MAYEDVLARTDFFGDAPAEDLARIGGLGRKRILSRGDHLFEAGEEAESMYVVLSGRIAIAIANEIDKRESMVALMEAGDLFGEMGLLDEGPRSAMARAIEPSEVLEIPYDPVQELLDGNPRVSWTVRSPTRSFSMSPDVPPSVCSSWPGRTTSSCFRLRRKNSPAWSVPHASA